MLPFFGKLILHFDPVLVLLERAYYSRMCASLSECMCAHIIWEGLVLKWKRSKWYPELRHQTQRPSELWRIDRLQEQRGAMVRRMETVVERDRWSRQKTSCRGPAAGAASRSAALGFMSVRICRKSCSPGTKCGEWMGERCKGMCGALRVWMIGEANQVPSEPSCHPYTFPILCSFPTQRCKQLFMSLFLSLSKQDVRSGASSEPPLWGSVCPWLFFWVVAVVYGHMSGWWWITRPSLVISTSFRVSSESQM